MRIPITRPWFDHAEEEAVIEVLRSRYVSQGKRVRDFEERVASYTGAKYAAAVSSCTAALHIATLAAAIGPGDEVLVPAFTWISTINAVEITGARPVFCDIDPATFNIDCSAARKRITAKTKAIIPVHLFGLSADLNALLEMRTDRSLLIIEDAACALGSYYKQKHVGTFGEIGCLSFHPRKSITTGEGGMLITSDHNLYEKILQIRNIGSDGGFPVPDFPVLGLNYRMNDVQGALGVAQFQKLEEILHKRKSIAKIYDGLMESSGLSRWFQRPFTPPGSIHSYQAYVCRLQAGDSKVRNHLIQMMAEKGIETRPGTHAPHLLSYYEKKYGLDPTEFPNALHAHHFTIALPVYPELKPGEQEIVCVELRRCMDTLIPL